MKVLCIQPTDLRNNNTPKYSGLRLDEVYAVLQIYIDPKRFTRFRIAPSDGGSPALYDSDIFLTVDGSIPENWVVQVREGGVVDFAPAAWLEDGFWERYFDGEPAAVATFEAEKHKIVGD